MAAAPADFRPSGAAGEKIAREGTGGLELELEPTEDILAGLGARRREGQTLVGFAAETGAGSTARAREKLERKGVDAIVFNDVSRPEIGFESAENEVVIVEREGEHHVPLASKEARSPTRSSTASRRSAPASRRAPRPPQAPVGVLGAAALAGPFYTGLHGPGRADAEQRVPLLASTGGAWSCSRTATSSRPRCRSRRPPGRRPRRARSARRWAASSSAPATTRRRRSEFEAVVETHPVNDYAHFCLGRALTKTGETRRARHHLALASNLRPDRRDYRIYRERLA